MLRPGIVGVRVSMVLRHRPCMTMSTPPPSVSRTAPFPPPISAWTKFSSSTTLSWRRASFPPPRLGSCLPSCRRDRSEIWQQQQQQQQHPHHRPLEEGWRKELRGGGDASKKGHIIRHQRHHLNRSCPFPSSSLEYSTCWS